MADKKLSFPEYIIAGGVAGNVLDLDLFIDRVDELLQSIDVDRCCVC